MPDEVTAAKRALRLEYRKRRRRLHGTVLDAAHVLARRVLLHVAFRPGDIVAGYWPDDGEIDPRPLLAALIERGIALTLPAIHRRGAAPVFRRWQPGEALIPDQVGMLSPGAAAEPLAPDVMLVPLVAFDSACNRLGRGAGYMDRAIAALRPGARTVGLAWADQCAGSVPTAAHDRPLEIVVTERGVFRRPRQPGPSGR